MDRTGAAFRRRATGLLARVLQHEIDHLDGILFIDRLDKVTRDRLKRQIRREGFPGRARGGRDQALIAVPPGPRPAGAA